MQGNFLNGRFDGKLMVILGYERRHRGSVLKLAGTPAAGETSREGISQDTTTDAYANNVHCDLDVARQSAELGFR